MRGETTLSEQQPHLSLELKHRLGVLDLNVAFELTQPWTVLFGPSGSGKSTILRAIAGLLRPDQAKIILRSSQHEQVAVDTASGILVAPHKRGVRWSAQRPTLFPLRTVRENIRMAFHDLPREESGRATDTVLDHFRIGSLADAMPQNLSGGEQHRVTLARAAAAAQGRLLLLDEPFTGLDAPLRDELLKLLQAWLMPRGAPVLSVTHDVGEAFLLGAEVIRLGDGRVLAHGPVTEVLAEERVRLIGLLDPAKADPPPGPKDQEPNYEPK